MKVWQPGGHLTQRRDAPEIDDWSWARTVRRVSTLASCCATMMSCFSSLAKAASTAASDAGRPIDRGICKCGNSTVFLIGNTGRL